MTIADPELIKHLNAVLKYKLTGINQYFLHARTLKHLGHMKLADYEYKASIDAMKHSDMLVEHILALGGFPNLQDLGRLMIGETPHDMLCNDLTYSESLLVEIRAAIAFCEQKRQEGSIKLLTRIAECKQEHLTNLRQQIALLGVHTPQLKDCA